MTNDNQDRVQEPLAAEYVLGTMQGDERIRFEQRLVSDMGLQAEVTAWEERLTPMLDVLDSVQPPPGVWQQIQEKTSAKVLWIFCKAILQHKNVFKQSRILSRRSV